MLPALLGAVLFTLLGLELPAGVAGVLSALLFMLGARLGLLLSSLLFELGVGLGALITLTLSALLFVLGEGLACLLSALLLMLGVGLALVLSLFLVLGIGLLDWSDVSMLFPPSLFLESVGLCATFSAGYCWFVTGLYALLSALPLA